MSRPRRPLPWRPTARGWAATVAAVALAASGIWTGVDSLAIVGVALGAALAASAVWGVLVLLAAPRTPPEQIAFREHPTAGAVVAGVIALESRRGLQRIARSLVDSGVHGLGAREGVEVESARAVKRPGGVSIDVRVSCLTRGRHSIGPIAATILDPFGCVQVNVPLLGRCEVPVAPALVPVRRESVDPDAGDVAAALTGDHRGPVLREYNPGDDMRHVHWPSSARLGQMMVRTPESDATTTRLVLTLVPDQPGDALEWAVATGASIAVAIVEDGGDVHFAVPAGARLMQIVERGHTGRDAILDCATDAAPGRADPLALLAHGDSRREPATVVLPPGLGEERLAYLGRVGHPGDVAVVPDEHLVGIAALREAGWLVAEARGEE